MHANFFTEVNNLGTKGQFIGVTCRAVALRGGGLALFAGCFVAQKRSRGVLSLTARPKTRHICPTFYLYKTASAKGAGSCKLGAPPQDSDRLVSERRKRDSMHAFASIPHITFAELNTVSAQ